MEVDALVFDVFGTLVDWRSSLIDDLTEFGRRRGLEVQWMEFVEAWRGEYLPSMDRVRYGQRPWTSLDTLHRESFDVLADRFGFGKQLDEDARRWCVLRWHHLRPWPDTVPGLTRLRERRITATLSNGNMRLLIDLARNAPLPMDAILSAELFHHYKPDPEVYRGAVELLATSAERVMLVAAHPLDLRAAQAQGLRTAFVSRPLEHGPKEPPKDEPGDEFDFTVKSLEELAQKLESSA